MSFQDAFVAELEHEAKSTRKLLERVPADKFEWAPHEKSMKLGALASHIAALGGRAQMLLDREEFDTQSPEAVAMRPSPAKTPQELVERWDKGVGISRQVVSAASDEDITKTYTLKSGANTIFSLPRKIALRAFVLNHIIHHRGQLSVYLRQLDVPIPSIYGPSADERP